jgi:O-antigen ligase
MKNLEGSGQSGGLKPANPFAALTDFLWALLLLTIPVTSSPWVARATGRTGVSPLAGIPLLALVLLWLIPYLVRRGRLSRLSLPLLFFIAIALLASLAAFFRPVYPVSGASLAGREVRAFVTLGVGVCFYLVLSTYPQSRAGLKGSLKWLYFGAAIMLIWSTLQSLLVIRNYYWDMHQMLDIPDIFVDIHRIFSIRDPLPRRVTGLAFEPSWLADMLVVLYLPLWLASMIKGFSVFKKPFRRISWETVFFIWGAGILLLTQSRMGFISFFAIIGVIMLVGSWRLAGRIQKGREARASLSEEGAVRRRVLLGQGVLWAAIMLALFVAFIATVMVAGVFDDRVGSLFETDYLEILRYQEDPGLYLANTLYSAERVIYWITGFRIFSQHPVLGVGLGNAGFFFLDNLPSFGTRLPEVIRILNGEAFFPNLKSLWVRLLAETGMLGFLGFMAWIVVVAAAAWKTWRGSHGVQSVIAMATLFGLLAYAFEGFSLDTFALPQVWVLPGLLTAAVVVGGREGTNNPGLDD